jgi:hypothetical protein
MKTRRAAGPAGQEMTADYIGYLLHRTGCYVYLVRPYTYSSGGNRGGNSHPHRPD